MNNYIKVLRDIKKGKMPLVKDWDLQDVIDLNMFVYKLNHGYSFDIRNPKTFSEKIQWYKFFYNRDDFAQITDKVLFKNYISRRLGEGHVIPMYGAWDNVSDLEAEWNLWGGAESVVLKSNLQSDGRNIKIIHNKSKVDFSSIKEELMSWLNPKNTLLNSCDWRFYDSKPMILAEKYMANFENQLYDYKFFCFNGIPYCMYVATEHFDSGQNNDTYSIMFYDLNWDKLDVKYGNHPNSVIVPRPVHYGQMIEFAKILSKDFPFMRVDFFDTEEKLYLAELTFNPGGGMVPYIPIEFNETMGDMFKLPVL